MRDKIIELISQVQYMGGLEVKLADYLISKGVTILPEGAIILTRAEIEALNEHNEKVKRELAREIFEEIEKTFKDCLWFLKNHPSNYPRMDRTKINVYKDTLLYLAELKKKYTEEGG